VKTVRNAFVQALLKYLRELGDCFLNDPLLRSAGQEGRRFNRFNEDLAEQDRRLVEYSGAPAGYSDKSPS
jgi:hypothetical protein